MRRKRLHVLAAGLVALATISPARAAEDETWDGLTRVESKRLERVYLLKGADFRTYKKVMIAEPQVAFRKDWAADVNRGVREPSRRITKSDVEKIQRALAQGFQGILSADFAKAGWEVVGTAGPDVLQLTPLLLNVDITAPQRITESRGEAYTVQTGQATVGLEVRDAETSMLLGRAVDRKSADSFGGRLTVTDRVTNRSDFEAMLMGWSRIFVEGLAALKDASPLGASKARP